ncbi:(d)CMP kinase [Candidatus Phytoplasma melaleucae]|uniref:Cytidylate kinase n=1 Tax=Candidatus Phytoplasma melaleucae TaxID=2982630 RepID=A0ABT9DDF5_9MOLU|nr:(d)CMP kinase ['Melaleuca sp.' phytoplasma]MDO8168074.1 (d)CMP kinase ['Melaleuca sp.' phytoplasma]MDV3205355.1 (d)CMP kinase [Weeping tea tree witches'-broom phytoplasma]
MLSFKLAIDGPAGSGKSTISKLLSEKLKWFYVNTGIFFRIITFYILTNNIPYKENYDEKKLQILLQQIKITSNNNNFYLNNENITPFLQNEQIEKEISILSSLCVIRNKILNLQKQIIQQHNFIIMDGRDIGTVVMPDANLKIFLTASIKTRALRKQKEIMETKKQNINFKEIINNIKMRDLQDIKRKIAPLKKSKDAVVLDSTNLNVNEVVNIIKVLIQMKINNDQNDF